MYESPRCATQHVVGIFVSWLDENWFNLLQTAGIVGGLAFTGWSARRENRSRKIENLLSIHDNHRSIWLQIFDDPHLLRVLKPKGRLKDKAVTMQERIFVNLIILHVTSVLTAMRAGVMEKPAGFDVDLKDFFSLPIPKQVWRDTLKFRDDETRRYVESMAGWNPPCRPRFHFSPVRLLPAIRLRSAQGRRARIHRRSPSTKRVKQLPQLFRRIRP